MITLKRAYDSVSRTDGTRFLVERLWPRGVSKAKLRVEAWLKEVGPSTELRSGLVTIRTSGASFAGATFVSSTPDRRPGSPSCQLLGGGRSRSSTARTTRSTTTRSPCTSTCEGRRAG
jgi:hypothetical protein